MNLLQLSLKTQLVIMNAKVNIHYIHFWLKYIFEFGISDIIDNWGLR